MVQKPDLRILLVASTNQAVDQALVSVDKALVQLGQKHSRLRHRLCRFGSRFIAEHYTDRDHLIPIQDKELLQALRLLPLVKRYLFAGDDQQLAPIVTSDRERLKRRWVVPLSYSKERVTKIQIL